MSLSWISNMSLTSEPSAVRKSGIICTIGPDTMSVEKMLELRKAGMNIVRCNFSHGSYEYHGQVIANARASDKKCPSERIVAIALDTKGPEIRTGFMKNKSATYNVGTIITITNKIEFQNACDENTLYVDYPGLCHSLRPGKIILCEDGNISFEVIEVLSDSVRAKALNTHTLTDRKNVNLPGTEVDLPAVSEKDKADLKFGVEQNVDMVFASFIRRAKDVTEIRQVLGEKGKNIMIISKIENMQGIENFDEILAASDGVMVARGDLGMEIPLEKVFVAQKMMIAKCNLAGKPVICATQMLESMTYNARPTRAEVSDVANAILDGADCVMLSGETAKGKYPKEAVEMMHRTCIVAESVICHPSLFNQLREATKKPLSDTESVAYSAVTASLEQPDISAIFVLTTSGASARLVSKYRPNVPIIAITRDDRVVRQLHLSRGCYPIHCEIAPVASTDPLYKWQDNVDIRIREAVKQAINMKLVPIKGKIITIQGWRGGSGATNTMRILSVEKVAAEVPSPV